MRKLIIYKAIDSLVEGAVYTLDKENKKIEKWLCGKQQPTQEQIEAKIKELETQEKVSNAYKALQTLCDTKSKQAKNYIAGKYVDNYLLEEYKEVRRAIDKNNISFFETEAKILGTTAQEEFDKAKIKKELYEKEYQEFLTKIRAFRRKVTKLIENGEIDKANEIIKKAWKLGADATDEDVKKLFKGE